MPGAQYQEPFEKGLPAAASISVFLPVGPVSLELCEQDNGVRVLYDGMK